MVWCFDLLVCVWIDYSCGLILGLGFRAFGFGVTFGFADFVFGFGILTWWCLRLVVWTFGCFPVLGVLILVLCLLGFT